MTLALHCEDCGNTEDVEPQFTTRLLDVTKKNRQPRWYCPKCRRKHRAVSALTGRVIRKGVK